MWATFSCLCGSERQNNTIDTNTGGRSVHREKAPDAKEVSRTLPEGQTQIIVRLSPLLACLLADSRISLNFHSENPRVHYRLCIIRLPALPTSFPWLPTSVAALLHEKQPREIDDNKK